MRDCQGKKHTFSDQSFQRKALADNWGDRMMGMSKLKTNIRFAWAALKEWLPERRRKAMKSSGTAAIFIIGTVFGIALIKPVIWAYPLLPFRNWAIIVLMLIILAQWFALSGARSLYERSLRDLSAEIRSAMRLGRLHGKGDSIYQCQPESPFPDRILWIWLNEIRSAVQEEFGQQGLEEFYSHLKWKRSEPINRSDIPSEAHEKESWLAAHLSAIYDYSEERRIGAIAKRSSEA